MNNSKSIRILYVIDNMQFGGGERVFLQLATGLKNRHHVAVAATAGGTLERNLKLRGVPFHPINMQGKTSIKAIFSLVRLIASHNFDIVHSQGSRADFFSRSASLFFRRCKNICTITMPVEGYDLPMARKQFYRFLDALVEPRVDGFIVVSKPLEHLLVCKRKIESKRVRCIFNGIEVDKYCPGTDREWLRNGLGLPGRTPIIGAVGRLVWQKGFADLLTAFAEMGSIFPGVQLVFVGDGPLRAELEQKAISLGVKDSVHFLGFRNDTERVLQGFDVLAVPSLKEGFPMIVLEGMATALPIVATAIDGINEQLDHEHDGLLVPAKDPAAMAGTLERLLSDRDFAESLGQHARAKVVKHFSVDMVVNQTEQFYFDVKAHG